MAKQSQQSGFSAVSVLLIVVIIALVAGVGYYVYDANNKTTDTYDAASESSNQQVIKPKTSDSKSTNQSQTSDAETLQNASRDANPDSIDTSPEN